MGNVTEHSRIAQINQGLLQMKEDSRYFSYAAIVFDALNSGEREVLNQLISQGPV